MPVVDDEVEITELEEFLPSRVDGVKSAANGFPILMLKSIDGETTETETTIDEVLAELDEAETTKATADNQCDACDGSGKMDDDSKCGKCRGTGIMPKVGMSEKELAEVAAKEHGVAASGQASTHATDCPTCKGTGMVPYGGKDQSECPDCDGTGKDSTAPPADKLARVDSDGHKIHVGDAKGREKVDKALDDSVCDDDECEVCKEAFGDDLLEKKKLNAAARNSLPDSAFALPGRRYPIHDENHARNALARVAQNGTPDEQAKVKAAVHRKFPNIGEGDASKSDGTMYSAPNPALAAMATKVGDDSSSNTDADAAAPGSPAWEAVDAQIAHDAALALKTASELIRQFAQRESVEVAVGEGNDIFDTMEAESALCGVSHALGIMAQMAFHEGLEAAKSLDDEDVIEKAGKRLSTKSVTALATARDHISILLGEDDPAKHDKKETTSGKSAADKFIASANKALLSKEIDNMTADELIKLLDERDAQKAAEAAEEIVDEEVDETAEKGKSAMDQADSVANAKTANSKAKTRKKKVAVTDDALEDEADQGDHDSANNNSTGAAKSADEDDVDDDIDLTPEVIEANEAAKAAKKEAKRLRKAAEQAALTAALTKSIEENLTKVVEQNTVLNATVETLREELDGVKKMAAPSDIVRMAPVADLNKSAERDAMDLELTRYEHLAKNADNIEYRRECSDRAKALRVRIAAAAKV